MDEEEDRRPQAAKTNARDKTHFRTAKENQGNLQPFAQIRITVNIAVHTHITRQHYIGCEEKKGRGPIAALVGFTLITLPNHSLNPDVNHHKTSHPQKHKTGAREQTSVNEKQLKPESNSIGFEASRHE
jgi:hypothetical protein